VLIVWDRLFGTFQEEERKEKIIYGLVVNIESFNAFYLQVRFITINYYILLINNRKKLTFMYNLNIYV